MGLRVNLARAAVTAAVLLVALAALPAAWTPAAGAAHVDAARLSSGGVLYDRSYKVDLLERLPSPPELVIFGGSRAQRFEPSVAEHLLNKLVGGRTREAAAATDHIGDRISAV